MLMKGFILSGRKLKTATNKTLVRRFRHFSAQSCSLTLKLIPCLFRVRGLQEKCVCVLFVFFFNFPEESCQIRCMGDTAHFPLSGSIWRSGGAQGSSCWEALGIALFMSNDCDWGGLEVNHGCDERHPERMGLTYNGCLFRADLISSSVLLCKEELRKRFWISHYEDKENQN